MRRIIGPEDFRYSGKSIVSTGNTSRSWPVCEGYEVSGEEIVAVHTYEWSDNFEGWRLYKPLDEEPDLFLKFAALHRATDFVSAALDFSHKYGLPGSYEPADWMHRGFPAVDDITVRPDRVNLPRWRKEAERAWFVLTMYEAALNTNAEAAERLSQGFGRAFGPFGDTQSWTENTPRVDSLEGVMATTLITVDRLTNLLCGQTLVLIGDQKTKPSNVASSWVFSNLLGAMYLQMYWLLAHGKDVTRCEHCGWVISLARPHPEGRKRRRDKRFCDDACRQANHRSNKKA